MSDAQGHGRRFQLDSNSVDGAVPEAPFRHGLYHGVTADVLANPSA